MTLGIPLIHSSKQKLVSMLSRLGFVTTTLSGFSQDLFARARPNRLQADERHRLLPVRTIRTKISPGKFRIPVKHPG